MDLLFERMLKVKYHRLQESDAIWYFWTFQHCIHGHINSGVYFSCSASINDMFPGLLLPLCYVCENQRNLFSRCSRKAIRSVGRLF